MVGRTKPHTIPAALGCAILLTMAAGCDLRSIVMDRHHLDEGLVIVLPGIDGPSLSSASICNALRGSDIKMAVELYDWTAPLGPLFNLCANARNRQVAGELAEHIAEHCRRHPGSPVFLIGHSGGTAIAAWAAEALPNNIEVDGIIMLASSLSPEYDLDRALCRVRQGIVSFYSGYDGVVLGFGTTLFGTMDRRNTESAGKVGFGRVASRGYGQTAPRLFQVPWSQRMAGTGYIGCHFSVCAGNFITTYVAPLLTAADWNHSLIAAVTEGRQADIASAGLAVDGR